MHIPEDVIAKLKTQVSFPSDADLHQFIADALNSYAALGNLLHEGGKLQLVRPNGETRGVVLPFQNTATKDGDPKTTPKSEA